MFSASTMISQITGVASERTRQSLESRLDVSYGSHPDERLDLFFPRDAADVQARPIHLFVHGGYWRAFSKSDYSFVADTVTGLGAIAAIVGYSLMPGVRMPVLIEQVRRAVGWLRDNAAGFGGDPGRLSASGHSAGAHLASYLFLEGAGEMRPLDQGVKSVLLISGLYDLAAVRASFLQTELALTPGDVAASSPIHASSVDSSRHLDRGRRGRDTTVPEAVRRLHARAFAARLQRDPFSDYSRESYVDHPRVGMAGASLCEPPGASHQVLLPWIERLILLFGLRASESSPVE